MMDEMTFHARALVCRHWDDEFHFVGFADRKRGTQKYLQFQRAFEFDEQDVANGMDTYHVEWCDQGQSRYGGVRRCVVRPGRVEVTFDDDAIEDMGNVRRVAITFDVEPAEQRELESALREIFQGADCLAIEPG